MTPILFTSIFLIALCSMVLGRFWLGMRQMRHVFTHRAQVPVEFSAQVSLRSHQKAADYTLAKGRLGFIDLFVGAAFLIVLTLLGGLDWLNQTLLNALGAGMLQQLALIGCVLLISAAIDVPFSLYRQFVLEERFGFNKMNLKLFVSDLIKSSLLGMALGVPLLMLILWLMQAFPQRWWLIAWGVFIGFQLLMLVLFPTVIAPLFNKFMPLEDESLKTRIESLLTRCGFAAKGVFVMDGSKRSAHGNAYFTGMGASKRIVFFDTLIERLSPAEIEAVLAHELGHFKKHHIKKRMVFMFLMSLVFFAVLGYVSTQTWFYLGLGVTPSLLAPNHALALILFSLVLPLFLFWFSPLSARTSRKHEFEADAFAVSTTNAQDLSTALVKLFEDNASTLTPDPVHSAFYDSHPPAPIRVARLAQMSHVSNS